MAYAAVQDVDLDIARAGLAALEAEWTQRGRRIVGGECSDGRHASTVAGPVVHGCGLPVRREYVRRLTSRGRGDREQLPDRGALPAFNQKAAECCAWSTCVFGTIRQ